MTGRGVVLVAVAFVAAAVVNAVIARVWTAVERAIPGIGRTA